MNWEEVSLILKSQLSKAKANNFLENDYIEYLNNIYILRSENGDIFDYTPSLSEQENSTWVLL